MGRGVVDTACAPPLRDSGAISYSIMTSACCGVAKHGDILMPWKSGAMDPSLRNSVVMSRADNAASYQPRFLRRRKWHRLTRQGEQYAFEDICVASAEYTGTPCSVESVLGKWQYDADLLDAETDETILETVSWGATGKGVMRCDTIYVLFRTMRFEYGCFVSLHPSHRKSPSRHFIMAIHHEVLRRVFGHTPAGRLHGSLVLESEFGSPGAV